MLQALVILSSLTGAGFGFYAWFFEGTGVTGTPGALIAFAGAVAVWAASVLLALVRSRSSARGFLIPLVGIGALLTAVAAWFLMQNYFVIAMAVAFVAVVAAAITTLRHGRVGP